MDKIYKNCGFGSCEHRGTDHTHPFIDEGDYNGFPLDKPGENPEWDRPIADSIKIGRKDSSQVGRNKPTFDIGTTEAKIIPFPSRGK